MIDGEIAWTEDFESFIEDSTTTVIDTDSTETNNSLNTVKKPDTPSYSMVFNSKLYPNPTSEQTRVVIRVHKTATFDIYLYAIDGKRVKNIYQGLIQTGRREFLIDLGEYQSGSYLIVINGDRQKESLRLEKM